MGQGMILNTGEIWEPKQEDIIAWERAYPSVNVYQELMGMESWLDANPTKRKTSRGIKSFVVRWLSKSQDRGGNSPYTKKKNRLRDKTPDMQLADISWLHGEEREIQKQYYLTKFGYYYDGELHGKAI